jgi:uncharacterized membrane protein (DUF441 family)
MSKKTIGYILIALGVILAIVSLAADVIGIGGAGFGWKQILGTAIGVIVAIVGVWLALSKPDQKN